VPKLSLVGGRPTKVIDFMIFSSDEKSRQKLVNFRQKTSIDQKPTEVSPKPIKKLTSVSIELTYVGQFL
jgi:hypothetical protein